MNLTHILVGDLIAVPVDHNRWTKMPMVSHAIYRITKRSPTQAEAVNIYSTATIRIRVADGKVIGKDYTRAVEATPELIAQHKTQNSTLNRHIESQRKLEDLEHALNRSTLTTVQLEALAEAWEQIKAMGPKEAA